MRDIVRDLSHGPARLPSVHPDDQAPRVVEPTTTPLRLPAGIALINKMCEAADAQDRAAKMETLARVEIARLRPKSLCTTMS